MVWNIETEIDKLSICASLLGKYIYHNRYWFFRRKGRLFVENAVLGGEELQQ
ncbi:hypothetical protein ACP70R_045611 [Stipagrostis hirtigluma subsp. patula]